MSETPIVILLLRPRSFYDEVQTQLDAIDRPPGELHLAMELSLELMKHWQLRKWKWATRDC